MGFPFLLLTEKWKERNVDTCGLCSGTESGRIRRSCWGKSIFETSYHLLKPHIWYMSSRLTVDNIKTGTKKKWNHAKDDNTENKKHLSWRPGARTKASCRASSWRAWRKLDENLKIWNDSLSVCRTLWRSDHEVRLSRPPPPTARHQPPTHDT